MLLQSTTSSASRLAKAGLGCFDSRDFFTPRTTKVRAMTASAAPALETTLANAKLDDRFTLEKGRVFLTGTQAFVRLMMLQRQRDAAAGLNTAGFVSGYRGSPLARLDQTFWQAGKHLTDNHITFTPGINEDLGAAAVWGSQQVNLFPGAKYDGVFALWYGKGPGVDRSMDAFRHANAAGTSRHGGVLALLGDDHGCESSTLGHQSDHNMMSAMVPVLHPATLQEYLDLGILGLAMSRYAGCWVGFKCVTELVESTASVVVDPDRVHVRLPDDYTPPAGGLHIRWPDPPLPQEARTYHKIEAALAFARANKIDDLTVDSPNATLGIATTGKAYLDVLQALDLLGLTETDLARYGVRLYKIALVWPLEPQGAKAFAKGLKDILVIEEKRDMIESQLKQLLYGQPGAPTIVGKKDAAEAPLLPSADELTPALVARVLARFLDAQGKGGAKLADRLANVDRAEADLKSRQEKVVRLPYYCSGCPHNTSTKVPEGSRAVVGIGCHYMVQWMDRNSLTLTHMGAEGVTWLGQAPFTTEKHVFANLGDGTYYHSGFLAIRASVAAKVNITYKILYNDAVAMTGGQPVEGNLSVAQMTQELAAEGVSRIVVMSDEPDKYPADYGFAKGVTVHHRDTLDKIQKELRETPGTTVLIYDQTCAAEKRRRRKRGTFPDPDKRVVINDAVCEGCGDCSTQSNCVSVQPVETEFGRKRKIDQSSCNKDFSCLKGFCPSFVTVYGGKLKKLQASATPADAFATLPDPAKPSLEQPYNILITGIGGTGIITIGAVVGMAAHLEGLGITILDQPGLAQKNGAVMSHMRLGKTQEALHAVRVATASAHLVLGGDLIVSATNEALSKMSPDLTSVVLNSQLTPTAGFTLNGDINFHEADHHDSLKKAAKAVHAVDASKIATTLLGDSIATNMFILGFAFQKGLIPVSLAALTRAIELNGAAVDMNKKAFAWGRLMAHDPAQVDAAVKPVLEPLQPEPIAETLGDIVAKRVAFLTDYQNAAYAARYEALVERVKAAESEKAPGSVALSKAVAKYAFKLMAYKDEYEVARLYTNGEFLKKLKAQFDGDVKLEFNLAPPLLSPKDDNGHLTKMRFGPWMLSAFGVLAKLKGLRGTPFDVFGYTHERQTERRLIADYVRVVDELVAHLTSANLALAVEIASIPEHIRGFGHVKEKNLKTAKAKEALLLATFRDPNPAAPPRTTVRLEAAS